MANFDKADLREYARARAEAAGIPPDLIEQIINGESKFNPDAVGDDGNAIGIAEIWPQWHPYQIHGDPNSGPLDPTDPLQAINYMVSYIKEIIDGHNGDIRAAWTDIGNVWHAARNITPPVGVAPAKEPTGGGGGGGTPDPTLTPDKPPAGWTLETGTQGEPIWRNTNTGLAYDPASKMLEQPDGNWRPWDGTGDWKKRPNAVPIPGVYNAVDSPLRTNVDLTGIEGPPIPMRPLGQVPIPEMTQAEQKHYYPWGTAAGDEQATYDVLLGLGYSPNSGNPFVASLANTIVPLATQVGLKLILSNYDPERKSTLTGPIAGNVSDLVKQGRTTAFDNTNDFLKQLIGVSADYRNPVLQKNMNPDLASLGERLSDESGATSVLKQVLAPTLNPFTAPYFDRALKRKLLQYHADAPGAANQTPLEYLLSYLQQ